MNDGLLKELREWFADEVAAGDTALQYWVDRIDVVLLEEAVTMLEP